MNVRLALESILNKTIVNCAIDDEKIIRWGESSKQPTEKEINDKITELQAEYEANQYQRERKEEYPSVEECIHAILDDDLTALQAKRKLIKDKYPKP